MKINNEERIVETDGFEDQSTGFSIKQSARAFEILSSNIYSDKILAVVREYGTNALDAHVMADCVETPFEVHLPNSFEPWFSIRDFGPGLSHHDVTTLYTTYFHSTKDTSNDTTGCLGLGSKSGFAYTDQFTITSRFNGTKSTYSAYLAKSGAPAITKLTEEPTEEANGMEIYLPVKTADFNTFADRATKVFHRFPTLPIITGNKADLTQVEYVISGPSYKVRKFDERYHYRGSHYGAYAVQGAVAYPIEVSSLNIKMSDELYRMIKNCPVDIVFPIGEVNITASRERLNYDSLTQANIVKAAQAVLDHLPTNFTDTLVAAKTLYEAKVLYAKWLDDNDAFSFLKEMVKDKLTWNGKPITSTHLDLNLSDQVQAYDINGVALTREDPATKALIPITEDCAWGWVHKFDNGSLQHDKYPPEKEYKCKIWVNPKTVVVFEDVKMKAPNQVIRYNYKNTNTTKVYLIRADQSRLSEILAQLGDMPVDKIVMSSTLAVPPPEVKNTLKSEVKKLWKIKSFTNWGSYTDEETTHDMINGGFYVMSYDGTLVAPGCMTKEKPDNIAGASTLLGGLSTLGYLKSANDQNHTIFRVNSSHKNSVFNNPAWESIYNVVEPRIRFWTDDKSKRNVIKSLITLVEISNHPVYNEFLVFYNHYKHAGSPQHLKENSRMRKLLIEVDTMVDEVKPMLGLKADDTINTVISYSKTWLQTISLSNKMFGTEDFSNGALREKIRTDTLDKMKKVLDFYPLFFKMSDNLGIHDLKFTVREISHYVNLCDTNQKRVKDFYSTI